MPGMIAISTKISGSDWNLKHSFLIYILVTYPLKYLFFLFPHNTKLDIVLCSYLNIKVRLANCYNSQTDVQVYKVNCRGPFTPKLFLQVYLEGAVEVEPVNHCSEAIVHSQRQVSTNIKYVLIWKIKNTYYIWY